MLASQCRTFLLSCRAARNGLALALSQNRLQHTAIADPEEVAEFRGLVQDFATKQVAPHATDIDRTNAFPKSVNLWTEMGHMGLHGAHLAYPSLPATTCYRLDT